MEKNSDILLHRRVVLRTFIGTPKAPEDGDPANNYWRLIGTPGTVVRTISRKSIDQRVLVQFDVDVEEMGLHCHNEMPNSLWIKHSDLAVFD